MQEQKLTGYPSIDKPWMKYYSESAKNRALPEETIYHRLIGANKGKESAIALSYYNKRISFRTLIDEVELAAAAFKALGVKKGDIVAYLALTCPEIIVCMYALNKLGAVIMLLDPRRSVEEIKYYTEIGNVNFLFVMDVFYKDIENIFPDLSMKKIVISPMGRSMDLMAKTVLAVKMRNQKIKYNDNLLSYEKFLEMGKGVQTDEVSANEFELAAITFTGGTTGLPKGIMLSNLMMTAVTEDLRSLNVDGGKFRSMSIVPIFAAYGLACGTHGPLGLNAEVVIIAKPDPEVFCRLFKKHKPTNIVLVPGFFEKMVDSKVIKNLDMSFLISAASGGDTMSAGLEKRTNDFLAKHHAIYPHVAQGYGMSEMCSVVTVAYGKAYKPGSVGIPIPHVNLCVCEPGTTRELGYGQSGEICATGPSLMMGYLNNQEETDKVLFTHADGQKWFHSGDIGYIDEDGFLFFEGRIKRAIPRPDGHKVFPIQLENVISRVPNVAECACVGVKDGIHQEGQMPVVAVCLMDDSLEKETMDAIKKALQCGVEFRSQPLEVYTVEELPRLAAGKIDYQKIAEDYMVSRGILIQAN